MQALPILNIKQFESNIWEDDFYSNHLNIHLKNNDDIIHTPHKHDFFLCVIFTSGTGTHTIDFNDYSIHPGSIFFLRPGQTHHWEFETPPQGYIFFHTESFYDFHLSNHNLAQYPFYFSRSNPQYLNLKVSELATIAIQFKRINTEFHEDLEFKRQQIASLITSLYIDLSRLYTNYDKFKVISSSTYLDILEKLEQNVERHFKVEKSPSFYASKLNITSKHLNRVTRTTINKTTTDIITERLILEAKRLIVHSHRSLNDISISIGYKDYAYFSKVFKQKTNLTPLAFRNKYIRVSNQKDS